MPTSSDITAAFLTENRNTLDKMRRKIVHCLNQLSDADVNHRAFDGANSVANIVTHLCGNVGQWIVSGVGGAALNRDRPSEFRQDMSATRGELVEKLNATIAAADAAIAAVTAETILSPRKIQGYDTHVLGAIFHAVTHFEGHTHQIVYMTRTRLGPRYVFEWVPKSAEQVAGRAND
jgi:hypothetical protein